MYTITVMKKGLIAIPAGLRKKFHIRNGTKLLVQEKDNGILIMPDDTGYISRMRGSIKSRGSVTRLLLKERAKDDALMEKKWKNFVKLKIKTKTAN